MIEQDPSQSGAATPAGDTSAAVSVCLEQLVRRYQSPLIRYAEQMLPDRRDQAHDVVQMSFLRLRKAMLNGKPIRNHGSWLYRVAHNLAVDLNRREGRHREFDEDAVMASAAVTTAPESEPGPMEAFSRKETHELALRELQRLPDEDKQILLLKLFEDMTLKQIAELTETNIGTVHYRLTRGLRTLARRFRELDAI